jgi:hypothetical protein
MSSGVTKIDRYLHLPAAGGADDRFRANQPLSAGSVQTLCSNTELLARENALHTLWNSFGPTDTAGVLGFGRHIAAATGGPAAFPWDADPSAAGSVWVATTGPHYIRPYGSTGLYPTATLTGLARCGGTDTAGMLLVARPTFGRPQPTDPYDHKTVTSTTSTRFTATIDLRAEYLGSRHVAPLDERTTPTTEAGESGRVLEVVFYIGVYVTGGGGKATVRGLSLYLTPPPGY